MLLRDVPYIPGMVGVSDLGFKDFRLFELWVLDTGGHQLSVLLVQQPCRSNGGCSSRKPHDTRESNAQGLSPKAENLCPRRGILIKTITNRGTVLRLRQRPTF